ncbi:hypothetical protein [Pseudomonas putida]|uniref:hypothetical protein n=1 Tax=Pseudomonas putida TaxID=303 RepID=UPI0015FBA94A|nr:hypothetical protein [Pseudomonas putida]
MSYLDYDEEANASAVNTLPIEESPFTQDQEDRIKELIQLSSSKKDDEDTQK